MNEYDSNRIYDFAKQINYYKTKNFKDVDCFVLNTCHIREKATDKVYHEIGRIKKEYRNKKKPIVVVAGCVAQAEGEIILKKESYINAVIGPQSYHEFNKTILKIEKKKSKINSTEFEVIKKFDSLNTFKNSDSNVSSFLTIQEGCDKFCKFCVVPYTRGSEFSRSIEELTKEANELADNGAKEIILLGQNVNAYNFKEKKLSNLISEIAKIDKIKRIRYTTSHPLDFSDDLINAHHEIKKLMPMIHLPVQSGSNRILQSMNRKHDVENYLNLIKKLKKVNQNLEFSSDFIIGYPGEKDKDFKDTIELLKIVKFINTYSFVYSPRPGTPAFQLNTIDKAITSKRLIIFQKEAEEIKIRYRKKLFNKKFLVLFENRMGKSDRFFGRDEHFNSIIVKSSENLVGKIKEVKILSGNQNTLSGEISENFKNEEYAA